MPRFSVPRSLALLLLVGFLAVLARSIVLPDEEGETCTLKRLPGTGSSVYSHYDCIGSCPENRTCGTKFIPLPLDKWQIECRCYDSAGNTFPTGGDCAGTLVGSGDPEYAFPDNPPGSQCHSNGCNRPGGCNTTGSYVCYCG